MITDTGWKMVAHMAGKKEHGLMYKSNYKGYSLKCEIVTPVIHGKFGKEKHSYYADDWKDMFDTVDELKQFIDNKIIEIQRIKECDIV